MSQDWTELIRRLDDLEARTDGYVSLDRLAGFDTAAAIELGIVLIDRRQHFDIETAQSTRVTLCRLNRAHPLVKQSTSW